MPRFTAAALLDGYDLTDTIAQLAVSLARGQQDPEELAEWERATTGALARAARTPRTRAARRYQAAHGVPADYQPCLSDALAWAREQTAPALDAARAVASRVRECYHHPGDRHLALVALDSLLGTAGIEGWADPDDYTQGVSYCNTGDIYAAGPWLLPDDRILLLDGEEAARHPGVPRGGA